jgi:hypothetical protein
MVGTFSLAIQLFIILVALAVIPGRTPTGVFSDFFRESVNNGHFVSTHDRNGLPPTHYRIIRKNSLNQFAIIHFCFIEEKRGDLVSLGKGSSQFKDFLSGLRTVNM